VAPDTAGDPSLAPPVAAADAGDVVVMPLAIGSQAQLTKTASVPGGGPVRPGMEFTYQIYVACTGINIDCVDFEFTDAIPASLEVVQVPQTTPTRTVNFDPATNELTMSYHQPLTNPAGETGWTTGSNEAFDIIVRLPVDTPLETGDQITNVGVVTVNGVEDVRDDATVDVEIPVAITPVASKTWPGGNLIAGSDAATTATIGATNASSASSTVTSMAVVDTTPATWDHFNLTSAALASLPAGAVQAELFVCTQPNSACGDGDWTSSGTATSAPSTFTVANAANVTGVRVVFTAAGGGEIERGASGTVDLGLQLRDTLRSTDAPIAPESPITVNNCATATATDGTESATSDPTCANKQILSSTVRIAANKTWIPDFNGNWQTDNGEFAVAGAQSPVTARISATNQSAFPVHQITIAEPSGTTDFDLFDVDQIRLTLPSGATEAAVTVVHGGGTFSQTYTSSQTIDLSAYAGITAVTVVYTGGTADAPAIASGATGGLDLHGHLTAGADEATTLTNCAAATVTGATGTTPASATPCGDLPVVAPNVSGTGVKGASQTTIPDDQPVTFTMRLTNNGNLALSNPILTDPANTPNPFDSLQLVSASATSNPNTLGRTIQVTTDGGTSWSNYDAASVPANVNGVRLVVTGDLPPTTGWAQLNIVVQRRDGVADDVAIQNCFGAVHGAGSALSLGNNACATVTTGGDTPAATLAKDIAATELPAWTPGLDRQQTGVTLRVANTGNLSAEYLQITDDDSAFFDAVDFVSFGAITAPAGANRVQIDAFDGTDWVTGSPTVVGSPTLPGSVTAEQVRGLRFTFTSTDTTTNAGFVIPPCSGGVTAGCAGVVNFTVSPRPALVSNPDAQPTSPLANTVNGTFLTVVDEPARPRSIPPATDSFLLVPGDPQIDVEKSPPSTVLGPGSLATQTIAVTNNGGRAITDVSLIDVLPDGLAFDELYAGADGPYDVAVTNLPDDYEAAPAPTFEIVRDGERVDSVRWTFEGWAFPPNATITITFQVGLEPGVVTGQTITNTMGATGDTGNPDQPLACTEPDVVASDEEQFGDGVYCTDTADTSVIAGAAFQARKWVAGEASLGWWHPTLGFVPTGDSNCPSAEINGRLYTATPCVAIVERGGQYDYVLRVVNAGTESALEMALIDNLPSQGDSGLIGGAGRGTEWNNRPTLAGPVEYSGPGSAEIGYSSAAQGAWCTDDLDLAGPGCAGGWEDGAGSSTTAWRLLAEFGDEGLAPGQGIELHFVMDVPAQIDQDAPVTIAWNSFAHSEVTRTAQGGGRVLPPIEPIKVGVSPMLLPPTTTTEPTTTTTVEPTTTLVDGATTTIEPTTTTTTPPVTTTTTTTVPSQVLGELPRTL